MVFWTKPNHIKRAVIIGVMGMCFCAANKTGMPLHFSVTNGVVQYMARCSAIRMLGNPCNICGQMPAFPLYCFCIFNSSLNTMRKIGALFIVFSIVVWTPLSGGFRAFLLAFFALSKMPVSHGRMLVIVRNRFCLPAAPTNLFHASPSTMTMVVPLYHKGYSY